MAMMIMLVCMLLFLYFVTTTMLYKSVCWYKAGWQTGWYSIQTNPDVWLAGWQTGWLASWLASWLACWLAGWLADWRWSRRASAVIPLCGLYQQKLVMFRLFLEFKKWPCSGSFRNENPGLFNIRDLKLTKYAQECLADKLAGWHKLTGRLAKSNRS